MDEKTNAAAQQLSDEQLEGVTGGAVSAERFGHLYVFKGGADDMDKAFYCPQCYKMLHYTKSGELEFFRCMDCGRNFTTKTANPDFGSGLWVKLT